MKTGEHDTKEQGAKFIDCQFLILQNVLPKISQSQFFTKSCQQYANENFLGWTKIENHKMSPEFFHKRFFHYY